jgi:hypothetical protein
MPTNLTALIRQRLREGVQHSAILLEVRSLSPKPLNWKLGDITRIAASMNLVVAPVTTRATAPEPTRVPPTNTREFDFDPDHSFGIELELTCRLPSEQLARKLTEAGITTYDESYNHNDSRSKWKITTDATVHGDSTGYYPMELVSPILKGQNGINQIKKVCEVLDQARCKVNSTCGFHVHHEATNHEGYKTYTMVGYAAAVYAQYQSKFSAMLPGSRREQYYARALDRAELSRLLNGETLGCRYKVVNPDAYNRHGTVEFRQHSGTVNFEKIINWVKITQAVMKKARELAATNTSPQYYSFKDMDEELNLSTELKTYIKDRTEFFQRAA